MKRIKTITTMPAWAIKILGSSSDYKLSYNEMDKSYVFFRSSYNLLQKNKKNYKGIRILASLENLLRNSVLATTKQIQFTLKQLIKIKLGPDQSYIQRKEVLGIEYNPPGGTEEEKKLQEKAAQYLEAGGKKTRQQEWQFRLTHALTQTIEAGWFPLFGTYTVDPKTLPPGCLDRDQLFKEYPIWDRFIKKVKTECAEACGYGRRPADWPIGNTFFRYFAILEHGKSGAHPHVHVIFMMKGVPSIWKIDPNANNRHRFNRDIPHASALWTHGAQRTTFGILCVGSWFTANWKRPLDKNLKPVKIGAVAAVACYVCKYMQKGETKQWHHRVKATKLLGLEDLRKKIQSVPNKANLLSMATRPSEYQLMHRLQTMTEVPLTLIRRLASLELKTRLYTSSKLRAEKYLTMLWTRPPKNFYTAFMLSVEDGVRPWKMSSQERYSSCTRMLEEVPLTVHCEARMTAFIKWITEHYPRRYSSKPATYIQEKLCIGAW